MLGRYEASRAIVTGLRHSSSANNKSPYDIRFVRAFIRAALHGHSPEFRKKGWKPSNVKHGKPKPLSYLSQELVEGDTSSPIEEAASQPPRQRVKYFPVDPDRPHTPSPRKKRKHQRFGSLQSRWYATHASESVQDAGSDQEGEYGVDDSDVDTSSAGPSEKDPSIELPPSSTTRSRKLHPGDWVQSSSFGESQGFIYMGIDRSQNHLVQRILLHSRGNSLVSARISDIFFRIPGLASRSLAQRAAWMLELSPPEYVENLEAIDAANIKSMSSIMPDNGNLFGVHDEYMWQEYGLKFGTPEWRRAFKAKMDLGRRLRQVDQLQEDLRKEVLAKGVRELHRRLTIRPDTPTHVTVEQAYDELYGSESLSTGENRMHQMLAVHNYLFADSDHYIADQIDYLHTRSYRLRSREQLANLEKVREWIRVNSKEVQEFHTRVKVLRADFRQLRSDATSPTPTGTETLQSLEVASATPYTPAELEIIQFLKDSLEMKRQMQKNPYQASVAVLVKALTEGEPPAVEAVSDIPEFHYTRMKTIQLLKDIGVYVPWENLTLQSPDLGLDAWSPSMPAIVDQLDCTDGLDGVRHDFGNLPVYTIDEATASELDDGLSIEACPQLLDSQNRPTYWIHIHVADPTSSLSPHHEAAALARKRLSSIYFPENTWPMLPFEMIEQEGWSLGSQLPTSAQKVLTFSARVDEDGSVLDSAVRAAVVRNVVKITYIDVDKLLGTEIDRDLGRAVLAWPGGHPTASVPAGSNPDFGKAGPSDLTKLRALGSALQRRRAQGSSLIWHETSSIFKLLQRPLLPVLDTPSKPNFYKTDPTTWLLLPSASAAPSQPSPSAEMVAEFMILAGKLAAHHLSERGIAGPFRGQGAPTGDKAQVDKLLAKRDAGGVVEFAEISKAGLSMQPASFSSSAIDHWPMGIKAAEGGYLRATSPLRRYTDLVAHWQIKSTLNKAEASKPPFSKQDVEDMLYQTERSTAQRRRLEKRSVAFWKLLVIDNKWREALVAPEKDPKSAQLLLKGLTGVIRDLKADATMHRIVASITIPELGVAASLQASPYARLRLGQTVKVQITGVVLDEYSKLYVRLRK